MTAPVRLYPYQQRWLTDDARFKIGMFARQTGKTFTTTLEIVDRCLQAASAGRRERWVILSRGERQAREAIDEGVKRHAQAYQAAIQAIEGTWRGDHGRYQSLEVTLPGGSRITALPANPDTARGFSANCFLDEFAFHADSRKIWAALFPTISAGHKLRVVSTPNGKGNKFYDLVTGGDETWSRHVVDIHQAVKDGLPRDVDQLRTALADDDAWAQEYELQWLDQASAWLPYDLIDSVEHPAAGDPDQTGHGHTYIGNDIGRRKDLWVAWVLERQGDVLWTRDRRELRNATFGEQDRTMDELYERYRPVCIAMDQTGMGEKPVEDAQRRYGRHVVEGVLFTGPAKLAMATRAKEIFEDRRIRIPAGDRKLRTDLHSLKKVLSPTGAPRFIAEADGPSDSHADRTWAMFLAISAADTPGRVYAYEGIGDNRTPPPGRTPLGRPRHDDDRRPGGGRLIAKGIGLGALRWF